MSTHLIWMTLNSRSENGLLLYIAAEVNLFFFHMVQETYHCDCMSENVMNFFCGQQDDYLTVTMEKGIIYLRGNLLAAPASNNVKKFPVNDLFTLSVVNYLHL